MFTLILQDSVKRWYVSLGRVQLTVRYLNGLPVTPHHLGSVNDTEHRSMHGRLSEWEWPRSMPIWYETSRRITILLLYNLDEGRLNPDCWRHHASIVYSWRSYVIAFLVIISSFLVRYIVPFHFKGDNNEGVRL